MTVRARGRFYEDGPYTFCDQADRHPQPCLCAAPQVDMAAMPPSSSSLQDFYRQEAVQGAPSPAGCYWPTEGAEADDGQ